MTVRELPIEYLGCIGRLLAVHNSWYEGRGTMDDEQGAK